MFIDYEWIKSERSLHTSIPPANVRIKNFQRKEFPEFNKVVNEIRERDQILYEKK